MFPTCTPEDQLLLGMHVNLPTLTICLCYPLGVYIIIKGLVYILTEPPVANSKDICKESKLIRSWYLNLTYFEWIEPQSFLQL